MKHQWESEYQYDLLMHLLAGVLYGAAFGAVITWALMV